MMMLVCRFGQKLQRPAKVANEWNTRDAAVCTNPDESSLDRRGTENATNTSAKATSR